MERALHKMARQLLALDEASLMSLWQKYADQVRRFEPSERWEEAVLILSFIQSVRFKNQLFNHNWAKDAAPAQPPTLGLAEKSRPTSAAGPASPAATDTAHRKVLRFPGLDGGKE